MARDGMRPLAALRVAIVDDEELARLRLRTLLADCVAPAAQVVVELASAAATLQWLAQQRCDVLLLDIHMPGLGGLQLAERLRSVPNAPAVVFVTAHAEHALAAFDVQAVDYLTKPVRRARLQEALARVAQRIGQRPVVEPALRPPSVATTAADDQVIVVHERGERVRVPLAEVLYLKAELKYVTLRTAERIYLLDDSLAELAERLGTRLLRVHRNALVAVSAVRALERHPFTDLNEAAEADDRNGAWTWAVHIGVTDEWLAISRRQLALVRSVLSAPD
jgi:two-component system, LytTR family, response regulator AlgR